MCRVRLNRYCRLWVRVDRCAEPEPQVASGALARMVTNVIKTRRHFVRGVSCFGLAAGLSGLAHARPAPERIINREDYRRYLDLFTSLDRRVFDYFSDDMVFRIGGRGELQGPQAIFDSYRRRLLNVRETAEILFFCSDSTGLAAELRTEYRCIRDEPDASLFGRPLKQGEVKRSLGVALYTIRNGKFTSMHGKPQTVDDWHMAAQQPAELQDVATAADRPNAI